MLVNPSLEGRSFFLEGGPVGVLLIHGFTATTAEVRPLANLLHEHGYTVSGPLLPGHRTRPEDLNRVSWRDWVAAAEDAYTELSKRCQRIIVGGESTGALLALNLAADHPLIAGLLLYAPALRLNLKPIDHLLLRLIAPFRASIPKPVSGTNPFWEGYAVNPLKGTLQLLRLQKYVRPKLQKVEQPVLIVQGRLDKTVHPSVPEDIDQGVHSKILKKVWMENSGHIVLIDADKDQVEVLTLNFLQSILEQK
jgi:carboxylesterase